MRILNIKQNNRQPCNSLQHNNDCSSWGSSNSSPMTRVKHPYGGYVYSHLCYSEKSNDATCYPANCSRMRDKTRADRKFETSRFMHNAPWRSQTRVTFSVCHNCVSSSIRHMQKQLKCSFFCQTLESSSNRNYDRRFNEVVRTVTTDAQ